MRLGTSPDSHKMNAVLNQDSLSQIRSGSLKELESGALGLVYAPQIQLDNSNENAEVIILNNEVDDDESGLNN